MISPAAAKELDQFTDRLLVLEYYDHGYRKIRDAPKPEEVDAILDQQMNKLLDELTMSLRSDPPDNVAERDELVREAFQHRYLPALITPYEEWVKHDAKVPLYKVRDKGIYGHAVDYDDMRLTWYIELSPILQVSGVLIGIDKLGHFLAQGWSYYEHYQRLRQSLPLNVCAAGVRELGHQQEYGQLGIATGGVYSFADLAANWAGMTFFLSLFDDTDVEGTRHQRYIVGTPEGYTRVRDFHWREYVTPDWDEVLNPAAAEKKTLADKVAENMRRRPAPYNEDEPRLSICEHYLEDPRAFLGKKTQLMPRTAYALPRHAAQVAMYPLDVRVICAEGSAEMPY
ncbi:MAG TPA: hypothetical protein VJV78_48190 [Polyangiales bacterium]|nr:hypothetical protein [Polyangiales bacterium]